MDEGTLMEELKVHKCADGGLLHEFMRDERFGQLPAGTGHDIKNAGTGM